MTRANRSRETIAVRRLSPVGATLATLLMAGLPFPAPAAHLKSVYSFTGGKDGAFPATANLMQAADGSLYGTTAYGGDVNCNEPYSNEPGCGVVFKVDKRGNEKVLHIFRAGSDGAEPYAGLIQDASGNLYGTTIFGGTGATCSCGVVFKIDASGNETVLYSFTGGADGGYPVAGLLLDAAGNLYGTASLGGQLTENCDYYSGCGVIFKLDKKGHETVLYTFTGGADGYSPEYGPLVADTAGNLYGTTLQGGDLNCAAGGGGGCGVVFKLDTSGNETVVHTFEGGTDGTLPRGGVIMDAAGNLYGTTYLGGDSQCGYTNGYGCGVVFKLDANGNETILRKFGGGSRGVFPYYGQLVQDGSGNLYGTAYNGGDSTCGPGNGCGVVYRLDATGREKVLYAFTGYSSWIGAYSGVIRDAKGHLFGTLAQGGNLSDCSGNGCGMVYEITP